MIKVTLGEATPKNEKPKYPYFGEWVSGERTTITFFTHENTGVCMYSNHDGDTIGEYCEDWRENEYQKITHPITFENEF